MKLKPQSDPYRYIVLAFIVSMLFIFSSVLLSIYPQQIYINDATKIGDAQFTGTNTVKIKGNQLPFKSNDIISIGGRDYIRITGAQTQIGTQLFTPAVRSLSTQLFQNTLFEQEITQFNITNAIKIVIDQEEILIIPVSPTIFNIKTATENYNIKLTDTSYINTGTVMLKFHKTDTTVTVSLIGFKNYQNIVIFKI